MYVFIALISECKKRKSEGIGAAAYAMTTYIMIVTLGEMSGPGLNPSRSLPPAFISSVIGKLQFVHLVCPFVGTLAAAIFYSTFFIDRNEEIIEI